MESAALRPIAAPLRVLAVLAVLYTTHFAAPILVPLTLAILLALTLAPLVRGLEKFRIPTSLAAAVVVVTGVSTLSVGLFALGEPAIESMEQAPAQLRQLEAKLKLLRQPVDKYLATSEEVEQIASIVEPGDEAIEVKIKRRTFLDNLLSGTPRAAGTVVGSLFFLYFLLSAGRRLTIKLARLAPFETSEDQMALMARGVQREMSRYLLTITVINSALGLLTAAWLAWVGLDNPLLAGVMVAALNFAPYIGAFISTVLIAAMALIQLEATPLVVMAVAGFVVLTVLEGQLFTPLLLGRKMALSPYIVFLGIVLIGWLWGVVGALMAVPIMVCIKIACAHVPDWRWLAQLIAREQVPVVDAPATMSPTPPPGHEDAMGD